MLKSFEFDNIAEKIDSHRVLFVDWLSFKVLNNIYCRTTVLDWFEGLEQTTILKKDKEIVKYTHPENFVIIKHSKLENDGFLEVAISSKGLSLFEDKFDIEDILRFILNNCLWIPSKDGTMIPRGITRIDIALDDFSNLIRIDKLKKYIKKRRLQSKFKNLSFIEDFDLRKFWFLGKTIYLGRRQASLFIRFYNKKAKCISSKIKLDDRIKSWNRMEFEMKDLLANTFVHNFLTNDRFNGYEFILSKICFTEKKIDLKDKNRYRMKPVIWFEKFLNNTKVKTRLKIPQLKYDLQTLENTVENRFISAIDTYTRIKGIDSLIEAIASKEEKTETKEKYKKLLSENKVKFKAGNYKNKTMMREVI